MVEFFQLRYVLIKTTFIVNNKLVSIKGVSESDSFKFHVGTENIHEYIHTFWRFLTAWIKKANKSIERFQWKFNSWFRSLVKCILESVILNAGKALQTMTFLYKLFRHQGKQTPKAMVCMLISIMTSKLCAFWHFRFPKFLQLHSVRLFCLYQHPLGIQSCTFLLSRKEIANRKVFHQLQKMLKFAFPSLKQNVL